MSDHTNQHGDHDSANGDSPLTKVSALMEERRKFESWLGALEAKRAATPDRVFTRVHADYSARLDAVLEELTTHSEGLRSELASLTSRLTEVEERQQQQRDERAEAELRAHVGELSPEAWGQVSGDADKAIGELGEKHAELERELTRTRELLTEAERPATPRGADAVVADAKAPAATSVETTDTTSGTSAAAASAAVPTASAADARIVEQDVAAEMAAEHADADVTPAPTERADANRASGETTGTFDELAFLSSVVNTPTGTVDVPAPTDRGDERSRRDSFAQRGPDDDIVNLSNDPGAMLEGTAPSRGAPLAMNVTGNTPIIIKEKSVEAAKSLKCGECGSMNYPTEWYCERCGAELASL
jgi:hypothetical protein